MNSIRRTCRFFLAALLAVHLILPIAPCPADIYRWQDQQGHWHFSDSPPSNAPIKEAPIPDRDTRRPAPSEAPPRTQSASPPAAPAPGPLADQASGTATIQGGLLWQVSQKGVAPSHLLGTIHSADPRVVRLRPPVARALDRSERFIMEMVPDGAVMAELATSMLITDGRDLEALLGDSLYRQVQKAAADLGLPEAAVRAMKPWAVMTLLSMPKPSADPILDLVLHQRASAAGKSTAGLETAQEQLAVFDGISMSDQIDLLKMTLAQLPELPGFFDRLIQAYAADDLRTIVDLSETYQRQNDSEAARRFSRRLNDERNHRMLARMTAYLRQGNSFIAVGALHLSGPSGLLQLLRENGYTVTPIR
ncbi:MAG: TraB/GumN family protein [Desulfobacterales bacterium]|nr:TraB/GumN family protein [Desulfobacterales bacterium]